MVVARGTLNRRKFITLSALTSSATLLPNSLHATEASQVDLNPLSLKVVGEPQQGYGVTILYHGHPIARHNQGGEFSAIFQNSERSLEDRADDWKASSWSGGRNKITLAGEIHLKNLRTTVFVTSWSSGLRRQTTPWVDTSILSKSPIRVWFCEISRAG
jgi:hypothetical protein